MPNTEGNLLVRARRAAALVAAFGLGLSCGPKEYRPEEASPPLLAYLAVSPLIVVGVVVRSEALRPIGLSRYDGRPVQLRRITVKVENVLQGEFAGKELSFECFVSMASIGGMQPLGLGVGGRWIFFLRRDAGVWRTACDVFAYCVEGVLTGAHPAFQRNLNEPINDDIVEITYSRGEGATDKDMLEAIQGHLNRGFRWGSCSYERQLERLAKDETAPVRAAACKKLRELGKGCR